MALSNLRGKTESLNPWIPCCNAWSSLQWNIASFGIWQLWRNSLDRLGLRTFLEINSPWGNCIHVQQITSCPPTKSACVYIYINMNYICICKSIYMYIHIIYLQHPPVLNLCLLAKSTKCQPLKIKNTPGSFLEPEKCTWKIIPGSYPSSFIPSCDSNATTVGYCWCLLLASNQRLKSMHDMPVWDEQVARMVWKRANKAA